MIASGGRFLCECQPSTKVGGGGGEPSPSGAPASTHATIVSQSHALLNRASLASGRLNAGSAGHGGMLAGGDLRADRPRPRPRVAIGQERHRRGFARPMAADAAAEKDGGDVAVERRPHGRRLRFGRGDDRRDRRAGDRERPVLAAELTAIARSPFGGDADPLERVRAHAAGRRRRRETRWRSA